jgi:hypothetical protein
MNMASELLQYAQEPSYCHFFGGVQGNHRIHPNHHALLTTTYLATTTFPSRLMTESHFNFSLVIVSAGVSSCFLFAQMNSLENLKRELTEKAGFVMNKTEMTFSH